MMFVILLPAADLPEPLFLLELPEHNPEEGEAQPFALFSRAVPVVLFGRWRLSKTFREDNPPLDSAESEDFAVDL